MQFPALYDGMITIYEMQSRPNLNNLIIFRASITNYFIRTTVFSLIWCSKRYDLYTPENTRR